MTIFILITFAVICWLLLLKMGKGERTKEYIQWGLGVDYCCFYSPSFSVNNQLVTIVGFQEVLDKYSNIRYSVVKMNWFGKRKIYGQGFICGDFTNPEPFELTLNDIPNGEDYKIEIFNHFGMAHGQFKLLEDDLPSPSSYNTGPSGISQNNS